MTRSAPRRRQAPRRRRRQVCIASFPRSHDWSRLNLARYLSTISAMALRALLAAPALVVALAGCLPAPRAPRTGHLRLRHGHEGEDVVRDRGRQDRAVAARGARHHLAARSELDRLSTSAT